MISIEIIVSDKIATCPSLPGICKPAWAADVEYILLSFGDDLQL